MYDAKMSPSFQMILCLVSTAIAAWDGWVEGRAINNQEIS
jgi:hypothetical protein